MRRLIIFLIGGTCGVFLFASFLLLWANAFTFENIADLLPDITPNKNHTVKQPAAVGGHVAFQSADGPVYVARIIAGPFDLHRKYLSMEGPYVNWKCNVASLLASHKIRLPASRVCFTETAGANSMSRTQTSQAAPRSSVRSHRIKGLVRLSGHPRQLYWLKGIELTVLDENGKSLPTAEFICHFNLDVDPAFRNRIFNAAQYCRTSRIITLTQGQTKFFFPDGYAVPMTGDEPLFLGFQAANRTRSEHVRIRHLCRLYFLKDSDTTRAVKALQWDCPMLAVGLPDNSRSASSPHCHDGSCCLGYMPGLAAPNSRRRSLYRASFRSTSLISGHWVVPRGTHTFDAPYYASVTADDFIMYPRAVHAVWCHVHPLCSQASLIERTGAQRKKLFTVHVQTRTNPGLQIMNIENIYSESGIPLAGTSCGKQYELEAVYRNTTGVAQDSMVVMGIFADDKKFKKPNWAALGPVWRTLSL